MKNILFITWDGPKTSYMEGLFMPIFDEIQRHSPYRFHIIQFTWADKEKISVAKTVAENFGIYYTSATIKRKPNAILGSVITLHKGIKLIKRYIAENNIDIVMPRSTLPAIMVNRLKNRQFKLLFDADGFPLEERVDFSGLSKTSLQYQFLKNEETTILNDADGIITRSEKAVAIHLQTLDFKNSKKISVVYNGRDADFFKPDPIGKQHMKKVVKLPENAVVFVYCGSLGAQYGWDEMVSIFNNYHNLNSNSFFLILTGNTEYAHERIPDELNDFFIVKKIDFNEVPQYLGVADFAFAIREPKWSMQGVAPIKLGEYLLMGIPTIASAGIGDSDTIINQIASCFLLDHNDKNAVEKAMAFIGRNKITDHQAIRKIALDYFSLQKSAMSYITALRKL